MAAPEVEAGLERLARSRLGASGVSGVARMSAGATQEIWRFVILRDGRETPLVLRRAPGGDRVTDAAVGLETEAALIAAAGDAGVPVPPVPYVLEPEDGLGRGFLMGFVEGETLGGRIARSDALASARPGLARQCGEILARLHTIDPAAFPTLRRAGAAELLQQYREGYHATGLPRPVFELALRWLDAHCPPPPASPRLVHGDFRNGNLMVGPDGVRAVLDWELAHVGDPMADLGWICVNSWRFGVTDKPVGGFGLQGRPLGRLRSGGRRRRRPRPRQVVGSVRLPALGRDVRGHDSLFPRRRSVRGASGDRAASVGDGGRPHDPDRRLMQDEPAPAEVIAAVARFLKETVAVETSGHTAFTARVAANALEMMIRQMQLAPTAEAGEIERLKRILKTDGDLATLNAELARRIAANELDPADPALIEHLWATTLEKLAVDQPNYWGYRAALAARS